MKTLAAAVCGLLVVLPVEARSALTGPLPWFHDAVVRFLDSAQVVVLGWSKDGKAAVLYPQDGGGRGGPGLNFVVLDTVEDTVLFATDVWPDEFDEMDEASPVLADAIWYSNKAQEFVEAVLDSQVEPADRAMEVGDFPLKTPKTQYTAGALVLPTDIEPDEMGSRTLDWRLVVRSSAQGEKTIAQGRDEHAYEVPVFGYVSSPWEQRILVVYGVRLLGFEGERPLTYRFSGCLLTKGFAKK